jgi:hypothetical protein
MTQPRRRAPRALGLAVLLICLMAGSAQAVPVTLEFSGSVNNVFDIADEFAATPPPATS